MDRLRDIFENLPQPARYAVFAVVALLLVGLAIAPNLTGSDKDPTPAKTAPSDTAPETVVPDGPALPGTSPATAAPAPPVIKEPATGVTYNVAIPSPADVRKAAERTAAFVNLYGTYTPGQNNADWAKQVRTFVAPKSTIPVEETLPRGLRAENLAKAGTTIRVHTDSVEFGALLGESLTLKVSATLTEAARDGHQSTDTVGYAITLTRVGGQWLVVQADLT